MKIGRSLISRLDKKDQERGQKKLSSLWDGSIFFGRPQKNEKLTRQLVYQETGQNHMDAPIVIKILTRKVDEVTYNTIR